MDFLRVFDVTGDLNGLDVKSSVQGLRCWIGGRRPCFGCSVSVCYFGKRPLHQSLARNLSGSSRGHGRVNLCQTAAKDFSSGCNTFPAIAATENGKRERPDGEETSVVDRLWEQMDAQYTR
jgi:hypothetical protein